MSCNENTVFWESLFEWADDVELPNDLMDDLEQFASDYDMDSAYELMARYGEALRCACKEKKKIPLFWCF